MSRFAVAVALCCCGRTVSLTGISAPDRGVCAGAGAGALAPWALGMAHGSGREGAASVPEKQTASKKLAVQVMMRCVWDADQTPGLWEWLSDLESGM